MLISFNHNGAAYPPVDAYTRAVTAFRTAMGNAGIVIPEYTAWNEPNHAVGNAVPSADPRRAAQYWKALDRICVATQDCVVTAGDFGDPNPLRPGQITTFENYVAEYEDELAVGDGAATPTRWAIHPYSAINNKNFSVVRSWISTSTGTAEVWLTELGAMYCRTNYGYTNLADDLSDDTATPGSGTADGLAFQNDRAAAVPRALAALDARVTRAYWYTLGWPGGAPDRCERPGNVWDSALLGDGDAERPAFRQIFPNAPRPVPPTASTAAASAVKITSGTLNGSVNPNGLNTTYRFEYGATAAYGSSTAVGDAGNGRGVVGVSAVVSDLRPGTTYHFRIVTANQLGVTYGADQTLKTKSAVRATTTATA